MAAAQTVSDAADTAYYLEAVTLDEDEEDDGYEYNEVLVEEDVEEDLDEDEGLEQALKSMKTKEVGATFIKEELTRPTVTRRPEVLDDFIRNVLLKLGMVRESRHTPAQCRPAARERRARVTPGRRSSPAAATRGSTNTLHRRGGTRTRATPGRKLTKPAPAAASTERHFGHVPARVVPTER